MTYFELISIKSFAFGRLDNTGMLVECHNVASVMTFRNNLTVTACAVEMLRFF